MTSTENTTKKRKTLNNDSPPLTLQQALRGMSDENGVHIYYGLKDFLSACRTGQEEILRVHNSTYFSSLEDFGHYVTPRSLKGFTTVRDDRGSRIIRIHDSTSKIEGPKLSRAIALDHLITKGYDVIVFATKESDANEALALPVSWEIEEDTSTKKREHIESIRKLYHERGFSRVFTSSAQLCNVLSLDYMSLRKLRNVAIKLNNLVERQDFVLDLDSVDSIKKILIETSPEAKALERSFMGELLSCAVEGASWRTRINAFKRLPSANIARLLELKKPYRGKLMSQSTGRAADMCLLRDLADDDEVLFSTLSIDTRFYGDVKGSIDDWMVYKVSPDLGVTKERKGWVPLVEPIGVSAKLTTTLLKAIAASNDLTGKKPEAKAKEDEGSKDLKDDIDF